MKIFDVLYRFLSSKALTLFLMGVMAVVMAVITVLEAIDGSGVTPFPLYCSSWFILLLALVWVNMLLNLAKARSWKPRRLPLTAAHLGFLLILTGGYQTYAWGIRGMLNIMEGDTGSVFRVDGLTLRAFQFDGKNYKPMEDFLLDDEGRILGGGILRVMNPFAQMDSVTLPNGEKVMLHDRIASSRMEDSLEKAEGGEGIAGMRLEADSATRETLILQDGESTAFNRAGFARIYYDYIPEGQKPAKELFDRLEESIVLSPPDGKEIRIAVNIPEDVGKTLEADGYTVEVLEYHPDFKMGKKPSLDDPPLNPALHLRVKSPTEEKTLYTFALHEFGGSCLSDGTVVKYHRSAEGGSGLLVFSRGDDRIEVYTSAKGEAIPLSVGKPVVLGHGQAKCTLSLKAFLPSSKRVSRTVPDPSGSGPPAFLVQVGDDGEPTWLCDDHNEALSLDRSTVVIVDNHWNLGFDITLIDAVAEYWPASSIPKAFYSDVEIMAEGDAAPEKVRIETNAPLFRNGFRLYQSGMDQNPPYQWSTFSVAKDPGVPLVSVGFIVMSLGMLWLFVVRFILRRTHEHSADGRVAS